MISISSAISRAVSKNGVQVCALFAAALLGLSAAPHAQARLLVTDLGSHSVTLYNGGTGAVIDVLIPQGTGGLQNPNSLAYGPDGNLFVTDMTNVLRYNGQTGAFLDIFVPAHSGGLESPAGLAFGPDGNLYVASKTTHNVLRYDGHTGAFIDAFVPAQSGGLNYPYGLTFGPDHNLYVVDSQDNTVLRYSGQTGAFIDTFVAAGAGLNGALDLTFGPDGNLYVSSYNTNSILRYSGQTGAFIDAFVPSKSGGLVQPEGVTFAPDGNLYVASRGTHSILRYDGHTGAFIGTFVAPGADPTTPRFLLFTLDAPTGLVANTVSPTRIDLSWQDNSDTETAFAIWRRNGALGSWQRVGVVPPDVTTFTDTGLTANSDYTYRVRAISNVIASGWTNEASSTTLNVLPPAAPTGLTASEVSFDHVKLTWTDNSNNETAFAIWRKTGAGAFTRIGVVVPNSTSFIDRSVSATTSYTYRVRATNDFWASAWTNESDVTTIQSPPAAPTLLTATAVGYLLINLSWTDNSSNEKAFEIYRKVGNGSYALAAVLPPNTTRYTDLHVSGATTYHYMVRAANDFWASGLTNEVTATTIQSPPAAPTALTAGAVTSSRVNLSWTVNSNNATAMEVYRKTGTGSYSLIAVLTPMTAGFTDTRVSAGTSYSYLVRAANDFFASAFTNEISVTTGP